MPPPVDRGAPGIVERAVRRHDAALRSFLRWRLGQDDDLEDLLQETYERLLRYGNSDWAELPRALVMRIAANVIADRGRHGAARGRGRHVQLDELELESADATPERSVIAQEEVRLLRAAIGKMPERCQEVFLLSRVKGMTYPQIAYQLSISVKAVEKHIGRALAICRRHVGRTGA